MNGNISIANQNIQKLDNTSRAALISLMLATPPQIEYMSGMDVALTGRQRFLSNWNSNMAVHENATLLLAQKFCMESLLTKRFSLMSDGEKQKIMLLRCLLQETPLILLDEPLAFLDYPSKITFLNQLKEHCQNSNTTAIISSHEIELSQKYCHKLLWLKDQQQFEWFEKPEKFNPKVWIEKS
jgi:iron complex transport system ATP-binding protein